MDVIGRRATGRPACHLRSVSTVVGSCERARSRRFNTRRFTRVVETLDTPTISTYVDPKISLTRPISRRDLHVRKCCG